MKFLIDDIIHAFESNGNLHLVFGICSGKVDIDGHDLRDEAVTLIVPCERAKVIASDFESAVNQLIDFPSEVPKLDQPSEDKAKEYLGIGITIKKPN